MPIYEHSIKQTLPGTFEANFIFLIGTVARSKHRISTYTRMGVDGVGLFDSAERGQPFTLTGVTFQEDFTAAETKLLQYLEWIYGPQVNIVQNGVSYNGFHLINVEEQGPPVWVESVCGDMPNVDVPPPTPTPTSWNVRQTTAWTFIEAT